jgi:hypothetical protein
VLAAATLADEADVALIPADALLLVAADVAAAALVEVAAALAVVAAALDPLVVVEPLAPQAANSGNAARIALLRRIDRRER